MEIKFSFYIKKGDRYVSIHAPNTSLAFDVLADKGKFLSAGDKLYLSLDDWEFYAKTDVSRHVFEGAYGCEVYVCFQVENVTYEPREGDMNIEINLIPLKEER